MVTFGEAISNGFKNYVNFTGRSTRAEFWFFWLFSFIVGLVAAILDAIIFGVHTTTTAANGHYGFNATSSGPLVVIVWLALLLPSLALVVRRLRDTGRFWAWIFIGFVPFVGGIILLVFYCLDSAPNGWGQPTSIKNRYGTAPAKTW